VGDSKSNILAEVMVKVDYNTKKAQTGGRGIPVHFLILRCQKGVGMRTPGTESFTLGKKHITHFEEG